MAVLIHNNSVKLVLNLCKSEPTHMHLYFSLEFPNIFLTLQVNQHKQCAGQCVGQGVFVLDMLTSTVLCCWFGCQSVSLCSSG